MASQSWHIYEKLQTAARNLDAHVVADSSGLGVMWRSPRVSHAKDLSNKERKKLDHPTGVLDNGIRYVVAQERLQNQRVSIEQILNNNNLSDGRFPLYVTEEVLREIKQGSFSFENQAAWLQVTADMDAQDLSDLEREVFEDLQIPTGESMRELTRQTAAAYLRVVDLRRRFVDEIPLIETQTNDTVARGIRMYLNQSLPPEKLTRVRYQADGTPFEYRSLEHNADSDIELVAKALTIAEAGYPVILFCADKDVASYTLRGLDVLMDPSQVYIARPCRYKANLDVQRAIDYDGVGIAEYAA